MYKVTVQDYGSNNYAASDERILIDTDQQSINDQSSKPLLKHGIPPRERWTFFIAWYTAIIVTHILKGAHNSASKYLKHEEHSPPPYSVTGFGNLLVVALYTPRIIQKLLVFFVARTEYNGTTEGTFSERVRIAGNKIRRVVSHWSIYGFIIACFLRAFCKDKALGWTKAIFVQLMLAFTPFVVVLTTTLILRKGRLKWQILATLLLSAAGSVVLLLGESTYESTSWTWFPDWKSLGQDVHRSDLVGVALAILSTIFYGLSTVFIDYSVDNQYFELTCENLFVAERIIQGIPFLILAVAFGDLTQFKEVTWYNWLLFFGTSIGNYGIGAYLNVYATAKLGATTVGLLSPIRIIAALFTAMILLQETLNNTLQIIGIAIISISLISYSLWKKYNDKEIGHDKQAVLRYSNKPHMEPFSPLRLFHD